MTPDLFPGSSLYKSARISECGRYRYLLSRIWDESKPLCGWLMLNPSTADAQIDDATIRKCMAFARAWGYGGIVVANLFAWRSTDPSALMSAADPVGPDNDLAIRNLSEKSFVIVAAWGANALDPKLSSRIDAVFELIDSSKLRCLGLTSHGAPRHPLYVNGSTELEQYLWRAA